MRAVVFLSHTTVRLTTKSRGSVGMRTHSDMPSSPRARKISQNSPLTVHTSSTCSPRPHAYCIHTLRSTCRAASLCPQWRTVAPLYRHGGRCDSQNFWVDAYQTVAPAPHQHYASPFTLAFNLIDYCPVYMISIIIYIVSMRRRRRPWGKQGWNNSSTQFTANTHMFMNIKWL